MARAIFKRKVESVGVTYDEAEAQAIADIERLQREGFSRTSDVTVAQRRHRANWRYVATYTMSRTKEVAS